MSREGHGGEEVRLGKGHLGHPGRAAALWAQGNHPKTCKRVTRFNPELWQGDRATCLQREVTKCTVGRWHWGFMLCHLCWSLRRVGLTWGQPSSASPWHYACAAAALGASAHGTEPLPTTGEGCAESREGEGPPEPPLLSVRRVAKDLLHLQAATKIHMQIPFPCTGNTALCSPKFHLLSPLCTGQHHSVVSPTRGCAARPCHRVVTMNPTEPTAALATGQSGTQVLFTAVWG